MGLEYCCSLCACLRVCVLFALSEVRRHAWSALHCLTVVFSRCHWLGVLWLGDGIMCSGTSWVEKRAAAPLTMPLPPPQTPYCEKSLGWALWAWWIHCLAKCWPDWKTQCPWAQLILSILSDALSHKPWEQKEKNAKLHQRHKHLRCHGLRCTMLLRFLE